MAEEVCSSQVLSISKRPPASAFRIRATATRQQTTIWLGAAGREPPRRGERASGKRFRRQPKIMLQSKNGSKFIPTSAITRPSSWAKATEVRAASKRRSSSSIGFRRLRADAHRENRRRPIRISDQPKSLRLNSPKCGAHWICCLQGMAIGNGYASFRLILRATNAKIAVVL